MSAALCSTLPLHSHCVVLTPLCGLNVVYLVLSDLCTCLPDNKLPVGRDNLSHFGSLACSSPGLMFSSATECNINLPAPVKCTFQKVSCALSITMPVDKYAHS